MFRSFFKIALRYLWRRKTYSILNYVCLTFGLTCAIIAVLYIRNVFSYDKFHKNYNRIYAVDAWVTFFNGDRFPKQYLSASLTDVLKEQAPEIEDMTRISERNFSFTSGDKAFSQSGFYADSSFFNLFTFPLIQSVSKNVLTEPHSIAISARMAKKFFNRTDCIGETLILKEGSKDEAFNVTGIFQDVPSQSVMQFDFVIPFSYFLSHNSWAAANGATANATWILLKNNIDRKLVEDKIRNLIKNQEETLNQELFLFPLKEQILYTYAGGKRVWKEMQNIVIVGTISFAILLIACFNFINLAIALNVSRYKEAGIKKLAGSDKLTIVLQFLGETFIITVISLVSAVILARLILPLFNSMFNLGIQWRIPDFGMLMYFIFITLFTCLVSGSFPALYLASSSPINTLKGKIVTSNSYSFFRQSLIVFQFVIPVILIICMMIIKAQDSFMRNFYVGVDQDKLIILDNSLKIQSHSERFKAELLAIPGIEAVSFTNCIPTRGASVSSEVSWDGRDASDKLHFWCVNTDLDYNKTVEVKMVDGRYFNPSFSTDSTSYLINNVAAEVMKNGSPVGSSITVEGQKGTIIGVFKDFHSIDLAGPIVPTIISIKPGSRSAILIKYSSGSFPEITDKIRSVYKNYESEVSFSPTLFRDLIPFSDLSLPSAMVGLAFVIALILACMGLFGLASFTCEKRTREIGIRKANGATTLSVISLLLTSYAKWLTLAFCIALPIAFLLGQTFLTRFNFRTSMPVWAFAAGPAIAAVVAVMTVISRTWSVANRNPVKSLRYE